MRGAFGLEFMGIAVGVFIISVALFVLFGAGIMYQSVWQNLTVVQNPAYQFPGQPNASAVTKTTLSNYQNFDTYIPFIFFALNIFALLVLGLLNTDIIGYIVGFFLIAPWTVVSFLFSNVAHGIFTNPLISQWASQFPGIQGVFANLGLYSFVFLGVYLILIGARSTFLKPEAQTTQGRG